MCLTKKYHHSYFILGQCSEHNVQNSPFLSWTVTLPWSVRQRHPAMRRRCSLKNSMQVPPAHTNLHAHTHAHTHTQTHIHTQSMLWPLPTLVKSCFFKYAMVTVLRLMLYGLHVLAMANDAKVIVCVFVSVCLVFMPVYGCTCMCMYVVFMPVYGCLCICACM